MKLPKRLAQQIAEHAKLPKLTNTAWNNRDLPKRGRKIVEKANVGRSVEAALFEKLCESHGLPTPEPEYIFAPWEGGNPDCLHGSGKYTCGDCAAERRRWKFDWLFDGWLAVEKQGGNFTGGRHADPAALRDEYEKLNHAVLYGYCVLFFLPEQFDTGEAFTFIHRVLHAEAAQP